MRRLLEKALLTMSSLYIMDSFFPQTDVVFYFLVSLVISIGLDLAHRLKVKLGVYFLFICLVLYDASFLYFYPLILYNLYLDFKFYSVFSLL